MIGFTSNLQTKDKSRNSHIDKEPQAQTHHQLKIQKFDSLRKILKGTNTHSKLLEKIEKNKGRALVPTMTTRNWYNQTSFRSLSKENDKEQMQ